MSVCVLFTRFRRITYHRTKIFYQHDESLFIYQQSREQYLFIFLNRNYYFKTN